MLALLPAGPAGSVPPAGCTPPLFKLTAAAMLRSKAASQPSASQVGASSCRSSPCQSAVHIHGGPHGLRAVCVISSAGSRTRSEKLLVSTDHSEPSLLPCTLCGDKSGWSLLKAGHLAIVWLKNCFGVVPLCRHADQHLSDLCPACRSGKPRPGQRSSRGGLLPSWQVPQQGNLAWSMKGCRWAKQLATLPCICPPKCRCAGCHRARTGHAWLCTRRALTTAPQAALLTTRAAPAVWQRGGHACGHSPSQHNAYGRGQGQRSA